MHSIQPLYIYTNTCFETEMRAYRFHMITSFLQGNPRRPVEVVRGPQVVDRAGSLRVQPQPRLPLAAPMQQADWPRVKPPAPAFQVVTP